MNHRHLVFILACAIAALSSGCTLTYYGKAADRVRMVRFTVGTSQSTDGVAVKIGDASLRTGTHTSDESAVASKVIGAAAAAAVIP